MSEQESGRDGRMIWFGTVVSVANTRISRRYRVADETGDRSAWMPSRLPALIDIGDKVEVTGRSAGAQAITARLHSAAEAEREREKKRRHALAYGFGSHNLLGLPVEVCHMYGVPFSSPRYTILAAHHGTWRQMARQAMEAGEARHRVIENALMSGATVIGDEIIFEFNPGRDGSELPPSWQAHANEARDIMARMPWIGFDEASDVSERVWENLRRYTKDSPNAPQPPVNDHLNHFTSDVTTRLTVKLSDAKIGTFFTLPSAKTMYIKTNASSSGGHDGETIGVVSLRSGANFQMKADQKIMAVPAGSNILGVTMM